MFNPEYQRLDVMEYSEEAMSLLYSLMGEDVAPRRDFIMSNVDFSEIKEWLKESVLCLKPALIKLQCAEYICQMSLVTGIDISRS